MHTNVPACMHRTVIQPRAVGIEYNFDTMYPLFKTNLRLYDSFME
jgi:hypothetical protein